MTSPNAVSIRMSNSRRRNRFASERDNLKSSTYNTIRGSGLHQSNG